MPLLCPTEDCTGCSACAAICPQICITMRPDKEGFLRPSVDETRCVACGLCTKACPVAGPNAFAPRRPMSVSAVQNTCATVRKESSSGGAFSLLADRVLAQGGVVFGAGFDSEFHVLHMGVDTAAGLARLRGSKYVQSDLNNVFQSVRQHLGSGRHVLFSGTPCQIAGLRGYLGVDHDKLLCVDFVCHGVPSPLVFELWKRALEQRYHSKTQAISFRRKDRGWNRFALAFSFEDGREYQGTVKEEIYLRGFLSSLFLRPACHACRFKELRGTSDLTLADYWGVGSRFPDFDDDLGTSLVFVNTSKGELAFRACADNMDIRSSDYEHAISNNAMIAGSCRPHPDRALFFERLEKQRIDSLLLRMVKLSFRRKVTLFIKQALWHMAGR